jgi:hypothetical protein
MNNEVSDIPQLHTEFFENLPDRLFQTPDRQPEQRGPLHPQEMVARLEGGFA